VARVDTRVERIALETARYRIVGDLTLPREGYRSRLTDYLNSGDVTFIPLTTVVVEPLERGEPAGGPEERDFIAVARAHVLLAYPSDEPG
jgi:hypothetical protein